MPLTVALPIAHETGALPDYTAYYAGGESLFEVTNYFGQGTSEGLSLRPNPALPPPGPDPAIGEYRLYAFTHGLLSLHGGTVLCLRIPRAVHAVPPFDAFNSGWHLLQLLPDGPQLRNVLYAFDSAPGLPLERHVRALLTDAGHPCQNLRVAVAGGGTAKLKDYLAAATANLDTVVADFMAGRTQLFVRAGDVIGDFRAHTIDLRFLDSCGTELPAGAAPVDVSGRATNPSYYLYVVRAARNAANVNMLTRLAAAPAGLNDTHPLDFHLAAARVAANGGAVYHALDVTAAAPPAPRLLSVPVVDGGGAAIAGRGLPIDELGDWHESRNADNPFATAAPVRWRNYGTQAGEANLVTLCELRADVKPGMVGIVPGGAAFDTAFTPVLVTHVRPVERFWARYGTFFNVVADAFDIPCELLVSIACKESSGFWAANFAVSREMNVIAMEVLNAHPATIAGDSPAQQLLLTQYANLAGGNYDGGPAVIERNVDIPLPWNDAALVHAASPLTWAQLRQLANDFPANVRISPGMMQTLLSTARSDITWLESVYGAGTVATFATQHNGVPFSADAMPAALSDVFRDWFGVSLDAAGANTNVAANVDAGMTRAKRAYHNIVAGAAHIRRAYNSAMGVGVRRFNLVCDYDFPTIASGYNDAARPVSAAVAGDANAIKWRRLFALLFSGGEYPEDGTRFFNASVAHFNSLPAGAPMPAVRLWRR